MGELGDDWRAWNEDLRKRKAKRRVKGSHEIEALSKKGFVVQQLTDSHYRITHPGKS